ncbi:MAG: hypothetical protein OEX02_19700 [Cyclobacteriaceae bacterium]|nr:hypothetical protein [Cyclobacteriaceae bacterium]
MEGAGCFNPSCTGGAGGGVSAEAAAAGGFTAGDIGASVFGGEEACSGVGIS